MRSLGSPERPKKPPLTSLKEKLSEIINAGKKGDRKPDKKDHFDEDLYPPI